MTAIPNPFDTIDQTKAESFAGRVAGMLDAGAVAVMTSIGHRLGLFDTMARLPASSSAGIAEAAGLAERYVREWLAVMVMGDIVLYDSEARTYRLPAEHAASLTHGAPLGNLAVYAQHVALMGSVQERVLRCFRTGEGTAYADYPCFHCMMAEDSGQTVVEHLVERILPVVPGLVERLTQGIDVLDAGCGRGLALVELATRFPRSRFVGYDLEAGAIAHAAELARAAGLSNVRFEARDLTGFDEVACYDLVCSFDAVHDMKDPAGLVRSLRRALKPGGVYLMQDIGGSVRLENNRDFPFAAFLYAISTCHCTPVSIGQGGAGLGTMWGWETAEALLNESGFASAERHVLPHDPMNVWFVSRA